MIGNYGRRKMGENGVQVGDRIRIIHMDGEVGYDGREGVVRSIDDAGQIHGTWGGLAIVPECDSFEILKKVENFFGKSKIDD